MSIHYLYTLFLDFLFPISYGMITIHGHVFERSSCIPLHNTFTLDESFINQSVYLKSGLDLQTSSDFFNGSTDNFNLENDLNREAYLVDKLKKKGTD